MKEKENILEIFVNTRKLIEKREISLLKDLSNRTIHSSSIYQDPDNITVAVIVYALSKIYERSKYFTYKDWSFFSKSCLAELDKAITNLEQNRIEDFRKNLGNITKLINKLSGHLRSYIKDVFAKARITKASRIYEHGISMEQTAKLLGVTIWDLAEYAGKTGIADVNLSITKDIKERIKIAYNFFEK